MVAFYAAINALLMLVLGILVVRARVKTRTEIGDGGHPAMVGPLRAHANNTEYVPLAIILMMILYTLGANVFVIHSVGATLTVGRILHAIGLTRNVGTSMPRLLGMILTWLSYIIAIAIDAVARSSVPAETWRSADAQDILDSAFDPRTRRRPAPMRPTPCLSRTFRQACRTALASSKTSSAPKARTWACACSSARRSPSSRRPTCREVDLLAQLAGRAIAMAKLAPEDRFAGLAPRDRLAKSIPALDIEDKNEPPAETLVEWARGVEGAAMAVPGVTNSEGGGASYSRTAIALATTDGFYGAYAGTNCGIGVAVVGGEGTGMELDYDQASARHAADMDSPEKVGRTAGERTVKRLNPRRVKSQAVPVIYDLRVSSGIVGHFVSAISGSSIARGVSFLKDRMDKQVFASSVNIIDDPHRLRGLRSKPFDGEGVANKRWALIENGVLKTWLLDTASARQLGLQTTGHAARGTGGPPAPSPTNLHMDAGTLSPAELIADIKEGFYVTELIGMGVSNVTGDYSRGAAGFWIENGEIAFPVSEITIAGNLKDMFVNLTAANDLEFKHGTNAPTLRIEGMTVAGA